MTKLDGQIRETIQACRDYDDNDDETTKRIMKVVSKWLKERVDGIYIVPVPDSYEGGGDIWAWLDSATEQIRHFRKSILEDLDV